MSSWSRGLAILLSPQWVNMIPQLVLALGLAGYLWPIPYGLSSNYVLLVVFPVAVLAFLLLTEKPANDIIVRATSDLDLLVFAIRRGPQMASDILEGRRTLFGDIRARGIRNLRVGFLAGIALLWLARFLLYYSALITLWNIANLLLVKYYSIDALSYLASSRTLNLVLALVGAIIVCTIISIVMNARARTEPTESKSLGTEILMRYGKARNPISMLMMVPAFTSGASGFGGFYGPTNF